MALFGKVDEKLPYLTRFYQVEVLTPDLDETTLSGSELDLFYCAHILATTTDPVLKKIDFVPPFEVRIKRLKDLANLHRLIVPLMDALADGGYVPVHILKQIEARLEALVQWHQRLFFYPTEEEVRKLNVLPEYPMDDATKAGYMSPFVTDYDNDLDIPVQGLCIRPVQESPGPLTTEILNELYDLLASASPLNGPRLPRCLECNNPFIKNRDKQIYCSHRCADRAGTRRRRLKYKEIKKQNSSVV